MKNMKNKMRKGEGRRTKKVNMEGGKGGRTRRREKKTNKKKIKKKNKTKIKKTETQPKETEKITNMVRAPKPSKKDTRVDSAFMFFVRFRWAAPKLLENCVSGQDQKNIPETPNSSRFTKTLDVALSKLGFFSDNARAARS